jgi:class 3 adenylate cyclase/DNA-binding transcriptional MerR regulator
VEAPNISGHEATLAQLAHLTGVAVDVLARWHELELLGPVDTGLNAENLERVRLIRFVEGRGISADTIAAACRDQGDLLANHVELATDATGPAVAGVSFDQAAAAAGLDGQVAQRLWSAAGLIDQPEAYVDDVAALRSLKVALDAGLPEPALTQILRVFADALGRVADAEARLFHHYVHERLRADGLSGSELTDATHAIGAPLVELIEPTVLYFHRKAWERALREDLLVHLVQDETTPSAEVPGEIDATILFADLSGFTPLTEVMGDPAAAELIERFSQLVRHAAQHHHGQVVKQIGDEFMVVFTDPGGAVACALELEAATSDEAQFPAIRQGVHTGRVLYREGDYVGTTVNVAARVAAEAERHQLLVTAAVKAGTGHQPGVGWERVGRRTLRGIAEPVELFEVARTDAGPERVTDPVCLMDLDPTRAPTQLRWRGLDLYFCSEDCLTRFVREPERYR